MYLKSILEHSDNARVDTGYYKICLLYTGVLQRLLLSYYLYQFSLLSKNK